MEMNILFGYLNKEDDYKGFTLTCMIRGQQLKIECRDRDSCSVP